MRSGDEQMGQTSSQPGWPKQPAGNLRNLTGKDGLKFVRTEMKAGVKSEARTEAAEKYLVVFSGTYRLDLPNGTVALNALEMVRMPAGVKHWGEALQDTVLLVSKGDAK